MALQAGFIHRGPPVQHHATFWYEFLNERGMARRGSLEIHAKNRLAFSGYGVDLVAVGASNAVRLVGTTQPVPDAGVLHMATQTNAVGILRRLGAKSDDLGHVPATACVQTSGAVTVLALQPLLGMKRVPEIIGDGGMTLHTRIRPNARGACNLHVFRKGANRISGFFLC
jgi:hypothetical protein